MKSKTLEAYKRLYPNIMTPKTTKFDVTGTRVKELSEGIGIDNKAIFGVSVWDWNDGDKELERNEISKLFFVKKEAVRYYDSII